jgi:hypothetical protein
MTWDMILRLACASRAAPHAAGSAGRLYLHDRWPWAHSDKIDCLHAGSASQRRNTELLTPTSGMASATTHKIDMGEDLTMLIGPARDGAPLEIGVLGPDSDDPVIIHALPLRAKFYRFLR